MAPAFSKKNPPARDWILVVDDDEPIRMMLADMLRTADTEVETAADGHEALAVLDGRANEPLLVVADVLMPGMDGLTLARKLGTRLKRSKIAIMSGHLTDLSWWPVDLREIAFIEKPFQMSQMLELAALARAEYRRDA